MRENAKPNPHSSSAIESTAEATKYYRSISELRLGLGGRIRGNQLGLARNGPDAHSLGVLSMIAAIDPAFATFFRGYQSGSTEDDPLLIAQDLFRRGATLRPNHYWTHLALAQVEYLIAQQKPIPQWRDFDTPLHTIGQCISLDPNLCFAYADRSSIYRAQARWIDNDEFMPIALRNKRSSELRSWSLRDSELAYQQRIEHPWVGWQYGLSLMDVGHVDNALRVFELTALRSFPLIEIGDATFLKVDDLRGRSEAVDHIRNLTNKHPDRAELYALTAMIRLCQNQHGIAEGMVAHALKHDSSNAHANAVKGVIQVQRSDFSDALSSFERALKADSNHPWATYGWAYCSEKMGNFERALNQYEATIDVATMDESFAAARLGQARVFALLGRYEEARSAMKEARQSEPACDIMTVVRPLARYYKQMKSQSDQGAGLEGLRELLKSFSNYPRVTAFDFEDGRTSGTERAALLNGDFELGSMKYWKSRDGASWSSDPGYDAYAGISEETGCLMLHSDDMPLGDLAVRTGQTFPIRANTRYELAVSAIGKLWTEGTVRITDEDGTALIEFPRGDYVRRRFKSQVIKKVDDNGQQNSVPLSSREIVPYRLEIEFSGKGTFFVDDFSKSVAE